MPAIDCYVFRCAHHTPDRHPRRTSSDCGRFYHSGTRVVLDDDQNSEVTFTVFNLLEQEVIRLVDQVQTPGRYVVTWNGRNANGLSVSSGVYLYRLTLLK